MYYPENDTTSHVLKYESEKNYTTDIYVISLIT